LSPFWKRTPKIVYAKKLPTGQVAIRKAAGISGADGVMITNAIMDMAKECEEQNAEGSLQSLVDVLGTRPETIRTMIKMMSQSQGYFVRYRKYENHVLIRFY
jgi:hypothetical protein